MTEKFEYYIKCGSGWIIVEVIGESIVIDKTTEPQFVEFIVVDDIGKEQPQFDVRVWE